MLCPYCRERESDSDDHIYPQFLGGKKTLRSCAQCNNRFGHEFEGTVASDLAPFIILLRLKRVRSKAFAVWKRAQQIDGVYYDVDSDLNARPSTPTVTRDDEGKVVSLTAPSREVAKRHAAKMERKSGKKFLITQVAMAPRQFNAASFEVNIGQELQRLAMKISFAAATLQGFTDLLDADGRAFLLSGAGARVRIDYLFRRELGTLRPPLSHFAFVKGNGKTGRCYAIIQFFGTIQLYVILNEHDYFGADFALTAFLNPVTREEGFSIAPLWSFVEAPPSVSDAFKQQGLVRLVESFNSQMKSVFPEGPITLSITPEHRSKGRKQSST